MEAGVRKGRKGGGWGQKREEGWRLASEMGGRVEPGVRKNCEKNTALCKGYSFLS